MEKKIWKLRKEEKQEEKGRIKEKGGMQYLMKVMTSHVYTTKKTE